MSPTLMAGDRVFINRVVYAIGSVHRGDLIAYRGSGGTDSGIHVKRVIALEGQKVKIDLTAKEVYVDGVRLDEPYVYLENDYYNPSGYFDYHRLYTDPNGHLVFMTEVPEGCLFVMGDNRNHSTDSRTTAVGFVDENCIIGKVFLRVKPFSVIE
jgi:signal peptidase I